MDEATALAQDNEHEGEPVRVPMRPADIAAGTDKLIEAANLNGMAAVHEKREEFTEAQRLYEEALAIYEEVFGTEHFATALLCRNLGRVLQAQGKTAEASLMEDQATDILARRREARPDLQKSPFGGSSGFFELLGTNYTRLNDEGDGDGTLLDFSASQ